MTNLPPEFWQNESRELAGVILPHLEDLAMLGVALAEQKLARQGIYFDNAMAHAEAARWAKEHTDALLQQFGTTTQHGVGEILDNWFSTPGSTMGDLSDRLKPFLDNNQVRTWRTAVTEVTRAVAQGNDVAFRAAGIPRMAFMPPGHVNCRCDEGPRRLKNGDWVVLWYTERDDLVCRRPIRTPWGEVAGCRALHGVVISEGPYLGKQFSEVNV